MTTLSIFIFSFNITECDIFTADTSVVTFISNTWNIVTYTYYTLIWFKLMEYCRVYKVMLSPLQ